MTRYKFLMQFVLQIGLKIEYSDKFIVIDIPFINIMISTDKYAEGWNIFGKEGGHFSPPF